ncbi:hypothetical protein BT96DRAFT_75815 [Gymnopus androsaceus JB14]|uniref:Dynamin-type G domain-containing protein n=1 Tax=Gymnopus androsaceus JB14 TaxID=1447944 RepID=A0A6A4HIY0_9AGAR|nr:hypothetical protein BT96DRAFT_75815 [Gymnopus androsaceus JB14]
MTSDLSNALCASRRKELLALINQLRAVGAQNDLDLPRITVIGNQSAGKSSVVEAISGITVPRDAGTCTRCPMECRLLSSTGPWTCQISIRKEFDSGGNRLREVSEIPFGGTITDKSQVELALRRAQFSVLNPGVPQKDVLNASPEKLKNMATQKSMPFSKNVVCVDLEGPGLTDLTFIDLPGLIQNADREIVQLVESMAISHISDNTIILVACPLTDDIENQKAFRLARQVDPHGHRSICVLTKPDMLTTGSKKVTQNWLDVLEGRRHTLMHGYYCTRQPDDDERTSDITLAKAREVEELFFKQTSPWSKSTTPGRLGAENLVVALSRLLINVIQESLPEIITDTDKRLVACREELSRLPPLLTEDPSTYLLSHIGEFCSAFQSSVEGSLETPLIQSHRAIYKTLKVAIRETAPHFIPFLENEKSVAFEDTEDEDEDELRTRLSNVGRCSKNLTDIRNHISRSVTRELPNNIPFPAKVALIREFQTTWSQCVGKCFEEIRATTLAVLMDKIIQHFGRFQALQARLRVLITEIVKKNHANTHYLQAKTEVWLNKYKSVRTVGKGLPSRKSDIDISSIETPNAGQKEPPAKSLGYHSTLLSTLPAWHSHKDPVVIPRAKRTSSFIPSPRRKNFHASVARNFGFMLTLLNAISQITSLLLPLIRSLLVIHRQVKLKMPSLKPS